MLVSEDIVKTSDDSLFAQQTPTNRAFAIALRICLN